MTSSPLSRQTTTEINNNLSKRVDQMIVRVPKKKTMRDLAGRASPALVRPHDMERRVEVSPVS